MALLLTQDDIQILIHRPNFVAEILQVIEEALLLPEESDLGQISWLAFPLAQEGRHINVNVLTVPTYETSVRVFPVSGSFRPSHDGYLALLFDKCDGRLLALLAADDLNPLRSSAPIALACKYLVPMRSTVLAMLGSGVQAQYHLFTIHTIVPTLQTVRVFSPSAEHRQRYVEEMHTRTGLNIEAVDNPEDAVEGADIICNTAAVQRPIFQAAAVKSGALITSITGRQGIPSDLQYRVVVPAQRRPARRSSGWDPRPALFSNEDQQQISTQTITLVEVIKNKEQIRSHNRETIFYEQSGVHTWDAALLHWVYTWAQEYHIGTTIHLTSR